MPSEDPPRPPRSGDESPSGDCLRKKRCSDVLSVSVGGGGDVIIIFGAGRSVEGDDADGLELDGIALDRFDERVSIGFADDSALGGGGTRRDKVNCMGTADVETGKVGVVGGVGCGVGLGVGLTTMTRGKVESPSVDGTASGRLRDGISSLAGVGREEF